MAQAGCRELDAHPDGNDLLFEVADLPMGASFSAGTRTFSWTPTYEDGGTYLVTFTVFDASDLSLFASEVISIDVDNTNRTPVLTPIGNKEVPEGVELSFEVVATDPDGDALAIRKRQAGPVDNGLIGNAIGKPGHCAAEDCEPMALLTMVPGRVDVTTVSSTMEVAVPGGKLPSCHTLVGADC